MLRVHRVKFAGPGFNVTRKEEKGEEKRSAETECALASKEQKDCRLGRNAVGVLLASREVQGRMDLDVVRLMLCRISNGVTIQHNDTQVTGEHRLYTRVNRSPLRDTKQRSITTRRWALPTVSAKMGQDQY